MDLLRYLHHVRYKYNIEENLSAQKYIFNQNKFFLYKAIIITFLVQLQIVVSELGIQSV